jgi:hypothetical protein
MSTAKSQKSWPSKPSIAATSLFARWYLDLVEAQGGDGYCVRWHPLDGCGICGSMAKQGNVRAGVHQHEGRLAVRFDIDHD